MNGYVICKRKIVHHRTLNYHFGLWPLQHVFQTHRLCIHSFYHSTLCLRQMLSNYLRQPLLLKAYSEDRGL